MDGSESVWRVGSRVFCAAAWAPLGVLILHAILGELFGHEPYVDPAAHFLGGMAMAYFIHRACSLAGPIIGEPSPLAVDLLAFGLTCVAALVWEFGEFFSDRFFHGKIQHDLANTMRDLALGVLGAIVCLVGLRIRKKAARKRAALKGVGTRTER